MPLHKIQLLFNLNGFFFQMLLLLLLGLLCTTLGQCHQILENVTTTNTTTASTTPTTPHKSPLPPGPALIGVVICLVTVCATLTFLCFICICLMVNRFLRGSSEPNGNELDNSESITESGLGTSSYSSASEEEDEV